MAHREKGAECNGRNCTRARGCVGKHRDNSPPTGHCQDEQTELDVIVKAKMKTQTQGTLFKSKSRGPRMEGGGFGGQSERMRFNFETGR